MTSWTGPIEFFKRLREIEDKGGFASWSECRPLHPLAEHRPEDFDIYDIAKEFAMNDTAFMYKGHDGEWRTYELEDIERIIIDDKTVWDAEEAEEQEECD